MSTFITNLRQEILAESIKGFKLDNDLRSLDRVYASGATEAVVFYSARILEVIMKDAHFRFFGNKINQRARQPNLADMVTDLFNYNLLSQSGFYWAKGLRLLGNEVRHFLRRIRREEADFVLIFLEFIMSWYFCEFPLGKRQTTIFKGQNALVRPASNLLLELAWSLDSSRLNPVKLKVVFGAREPEYLKAFSQNVTFPLLLIEIFISLGDHASAERLVSALDASSYAPKGALKDRFLQLKGLLFSRTGRLDEALQVLEADFMRQKNDRPDWVDDETVGILAGVYKRIWNMKQAESFLAKSHETYLWGWHNKGNGNTYLGINAATTALWLNKRAEAQAIGREVKGILEKRRGMVQQKTESRYDLNYWDMVTLAEANLLTNNREKAQELYELAFSRYAHETDSIKITRDQQVQLIEKLKPRS